MLRPAPGYGMSIGRALRRLQLEVVEHFKARIAKQSEPLRDHEIEVYNQDRLRRRASRSDAIRSMNGTWSGWLVDILLRVQDTPQCADTARPSRDSVW